MLYSYYLLNHGSFKGMGIVLTKNVRTFAPVFHGIRFKVRRLFVVTTSNFFFALSVSIYFSRHKDSFRVYHEPF